MNQFQLLRLRRFAPLFTVQFLGAFNDNVFRFALIIFITFTLSDKFGMDTRSLVVISGGIFILPFFLFSALAGQIADKYEKSSVIQRLKLLEIVVMILAAIGFWLESATFLFVVLFLMGTQSTFFGPLKYGILPQHLDSTELTGGNGLIQMGTYSAILLGAIVGGMLASIEELGPAFVVSCVVVVAFIGWSFSLKIPEASPSDASIQLNWNLPQETARLLRDAKANREILTIILTISWFWFLGATFLSMMPTYGKELLGADEQVVTLMNVSFTIGIGLGSLLCEKFSRGRIELGLVPLGCIGISIFSAGFFFVGKPEVTTTILTLKHALAYPPALHAFVALALIGTSGAFFIVPLYAALQARVYRPRCAQTVAALNVMNSLFMVFSALFTVMLYHFQITIPKIFGIVAILNLGAGGLACVMLPEFQNRLVALILRRNK